MFFKRLVMSLLVIVLFSPMYACSGTDAKEKDTVFKQVTELQEVKPRIPVKIKFKRSTKGAYSWDLSGSDVEEVLKVDSRLKKSLGDTN